ncbi:MAG: CDP-glycerol glycerophosphotransferase family protein [Eubacteriales bacterium]|nr:CDP-glycerol glycerophosphotransferase family protein [Eubacteriales bacterium]
MQKIGEYIRELYRFSTLRILFPLQYQRFSRRPVNKKKAVFIESQLPGLSDSLSVLYERLEREQGWTLSVHCLRESFVSKSEFLKLACACLKDIADAEYIFLCDASRLISCIPKRRESTVVQLWHACGAFKKFGMSTAERIFGGTRKNYETYPYYGNLDYVTVSSPEVCWAYEEAMSLQEGSGQVVPIGVSRTDIFFQKEFQKQAQDRCEKTVPMRKGRKIILYAPTFRGNVSDAKAPNQLDIRAMQRALSKEYILLIKHHPVIKNRPKVPEDAGDFAMDVTDRMEIEDLLCVSDICISDYSSLVFEYSLFERPMIFFAYDISEYDDWRGFYYDYQEMTPGPVVQSTEEIVHYIEHISSEFDVNMVRKFRNRFMSACDGHATDRLLELLKTGV